MNDFIWHNLVLTFKNYFRYLNLIYIYLGFQKMRKKNDFSGMGQHDYVERENVVLDKIKSKPFKRLNCKLQIECLSVRVLFYQLFKKKSIM